MTENQPHQPQNQPGQDLPAQGSTQGNTPHPGAMPSYGSTPLDGTQPLPTTGYGQHAQQQYAPHGGQPRTGQHPSGGSAYPQGGQYGMSGAYQGTPPGPNWPLGP